MQNEKEFLNKKEQQEKENTEPPLTFWEKYFWNSRSGRPVVKEQSSTSSASSQVKSSNPPINHARNVLLFEAELQGAREEWKGIAAAIKANQNSVTDANRIKKKYEDLGGIYIRMEHLKGLIHLATEKNNQSASKKIKKREPVFLIENNLTLKGSESFSALCKEYLAHCILLDIQIKEYRRNGSSIRKQTEGKFRLTGRNGDYEDIGKASIQIETERENLNQIALKLGMEKDFYYWIPKQEFASVSEKFKTWNAPGQLDEVTKAEIIGSLSVEQLESLLKQKNPKLSSASPTTNNPAPLPELFDLSEGSSTTSSPFTQSNSAQHSSEFVNPIPKGILEEPNNKNRKEEDIEAMFQNHSNTVEGEPDRLEEEDRKQNTEMARLRGELIKLQTQYSTLKTTEEKIKSLKERISVLESINLLEAKEEKEGTKQQIETLKENLTELQNMSSLEETPKKTSESQSRSATPGNSQKQTSNVNGSSGGDKKNEVKESKMEETDGEEEKPPEEKKLKESSFLTENKKSKKPKSNFSVGGDGGSAYEEFFRTLAEVNKSNWSQARAAQEAFSLSGLVGSIAATVISVPIKFFKGRKIKAHEAALEKLSEAILYTQLGVKSQEEKAKEIEEAAKRWRHEDSIPEGIRQKKKGEEEPEVIEKLVSIVVDSSERRDNQPYCSYQKEGCIKVLTNFLFKWHQNFRSQNYLEESNLLNANQNYYAPFDQMINNCFEIIERITSQQISLETDNTKKTEAEIHKIREKLTKRARDLYVKFFGSLLNTISQLSGPANTQISRIFLDRLNKIAIEKGHPDVPAIAIFATQDVQFLSQCYSQNADPKLCEVGGNSKIIPNLTEFVASLENPKQESNLHPENEEEDESALSKKLESMEKKDNDNNQEKEKTLLERLPALHPVQIAEHIEGLFSTEFKNSNIKPEEKAYEMLDQVKKSEHPWKVEHTFRVLITKWNKNPTDFKLVELISLWLESSVQEEKKSPIPPISDVPPLVLASKQSGKVNVKYLPYAIKMMEIMASDYFPKERCYLFLAQLWKQKGKNEFKQRIVNLLAAYENSDQSGPQALMILFKQINAALTHGPKPLSSEQHEEMIKIILEAFFAKYKQFECIKEDKIKEDVWNTAVYALERLMLSKEFPFANKKLQQVYRQTDMGLLLDFNREHSVNDGRLQTALKNTFDFVDGENGKAIFLKRNIPCLFEGAIKDLTDEKGIELEPLLLLSLMRDIQKLGDGRIGDLKFTIGYELIHYSIENLKPQLTKSEILHEIIQWLNSLSSPAVDSFFVSLYAKRINQDENINHDVQNFLKALLFHPSFDEEKFKEVTTKIFLNDIKLTPIKTLVLEKLKEEFLTFSAEKIGHLLVLNSADADTLDRELLSVKNNENKPTSVMGVRNPEQNTDQRMQTELNNKKRIQRYQHYALAISSQFLSKETVTHLEHKESAESWLGRLTFLFKNDPHFEIHNTSFAFQHLMKSMQSRIAPLNLEKFVVRAYLNANKDYFVRKNAGIDTHDAELIAKWIWEQFDRKQKEGITPEEHQNQISIEIAKTFFDFLNEELITPKVIIQILCQPILRNEVVINILTGMGNNIQNISDTLNMMKENVNLTSTQKENIKEAQKNFFDTFCFHSLNDIDQYPSIELMQYYLNNVKDKEAAITQMANHLSIDPKEKAFLKIINRLSHRDYKDLKNITDILNVVPQKVSAEEEIFHLDRQFLIETEGEVHGVFSPGLKLDHAEKKRRLEAFEKSHHGALILLPSRSYEPKREATVAAIEKLDTQEKCEQLFAFKAEVDKFIGEQIKTTKTNEAIPDKTKRAAAIRTQLNYQLLSSAKTNEPRETAEQMFVRVSRALRDKDALAAMTTDQEFKDRFDKFLNFLNGYRAHKNKNNDAGYSPEYCLELVYWFELLDKKPKLYDTPQARCEANYALLGFNTQKAEEKKDGQERMEEIDQVKFTETVFGETEKTVLRRMIQTLVGSLASKAERSAAKWSGFLMGNFSSVFSDEIAKSKELPLIKGLCEIFYVSHGGKDLSVKIELMGFLLGKESDVVYRACLLECLGISNKKVKLNEGNQANPMKELQSKIYNFFRGQYQTKGMPESFEKLKGLVSNLLVDKDQIKANDELKEESRQQQILE